MRISDRSSDVCSSDLHGVGDGLVDGLHELDDRVDPLLVTLESLQARDADDGGVVAVEVLAGEQLADLELDELQDLLVVDHVGLVQRDEQRSEEHTSELQSLMRISYAVFCLKKKKPITLLLDTQTRPPIHRHH